MPFVLSADREAFLKGDLVHLNYVPLENSSEKESLLPFLTLAKICILISSYEYSYVGGISYLDIRNVLKPYGCVRFPGFLNQLQDSSIDFIFKYSLL